jgi:hypothetical protein
MTGRRAKDSLYRSCPRFLSLDPPLDPKQSLAELAAWLPQGTAADSYGSGDLMAAALAVAAETGFWLFNEPLAAPGEGLGRFEITVREGAMALSDDEIVGALRALQATIARQQATGAVA